MGRKAKRARLAVRRARLLKEPEPVEVVEKKEVVVEQPKPVVEEKPKPAKKTRKAPVRKRTAKKKTEPKE
tara:strand:+ start:712 stop:921 length:210 start_codon:yes stop_codon:yes gene_type:complete